MRRPSFMTANVLFWLAAAGIMGGAVVFGGLFPGVYNTVAGYAGYVIFQTLLFIGIPALLYASSQKESLIFFRIQFPPLRYGLLTVAAAAVGVFLVNGVGTLYAILLEGLGVPIHTLASAMPTPQSGEELLLLALAVGVVPGIFEELMFRGVMLSAWERIGTRRAVWAVSLLFALLHVSLLNLPIYILLGFAITSLVVRSHSLVLGMVYHITHNLVSVILGYLSAGQPEPPAGAGMLEMIGGVQGMWSLVNVTLVILGIYLLLLVLPYRKIARFAHMPGTEGGGRMSAGELLVLIAGMATCVLGLLMELLVILYKI